MYEKFAALAFAFIVTVQAQKEDTLIVTDQAKEEDTLIVTDQAQEEDTLIVTDQAQEEDTLIVTDQAQEEDVYKQSGGYKQTPQPTFPDDIAQYLTIPDDFGDFTNNIESIGVAFWNDELRGDVITAWVIENYFVENSYTNLPSGDVFMAEVAFIDTVSKTDSQILCFDDGTTCICAGFKGGIYKSFILDGTILAAEDGVVNTDQAAYSADLQGRFSLLNAGIGFVFFGQSFDHDANVWAVWSWSDDYPDFFGWGLYDVYLIQGEQDEEGITIEYVFSDILDLVYYSCGTTKLANVAFASATVLYALI